MSKPFPGETDFKPGTYRCPECHSPFYRDYPWKVTCVPCYLDRTGKRAKPTIRNVALPAPAIAPDMLRRLIQLCHPDRHGNSEAANIATRFLLTLKGAQHG